ncbi:MAG: FGGY family carbohydrate kinase, partial [Chloroflexi bacterium]|nr:FGGY family carbohydrate kinase [Chloroflexota bacterium]
MPRYILALDQGTTSSRAMLFDEAGRTVAIEQREFPQSFPQPGWVEHDPQAIWSSQLEAARAVLRQHGAAASEVIAIGITNQRETVVVWDRATGRPIHNAVVWQDRRTAEACQRLRREGHEPMLAERTGLLLDP